MKEAVSIVVPVYRRRDLVIRTLESIYAQTYRPLRLIIVDNNSGDGTAECVRDWIDAHREDLGFGAELLIEKTPGASAARNRGLRSVDTKYVIFFDSDDEMMPDLVESAIEAIGDADLIYWRAEILGLDGTMTFKPFHKGKLLFRHAYNSMLATQIYMARTEFIRELGGWNEKAFVWNDWELGMRIVLARPKVVAIPKVLVRINAQPVSITGKKSSDAIGAREQTMEIVESFAQNLPEKKRVKDILDYRRVNLAAIYKSEGADSAAKELLEQVLRKRGFFSRQILRLLFDYTAAGGRGGYYLWGGLQFLREK